jgi:glycosyltransferase involved in cell wall biosynthesis
MHNAFFKSRISNLEANLVDPMKSFLIFHPYMNVKGGAERKMFLIYHYLKKQGKIVKIITFDYEVEKTFSEGIDANDIILINRNLFLNELIFKLRYQKWGTLICSNYPANIYSLCIRARRKIFVCNEVALKRWSELGNSVSKLKTFIDKMSVKQFDDVVANSKNTAREIRNYYVLEPKIVYSGLEMQYMEGLRGKKIPDLEDKEFYFTLSRASFDKNISFLPKLLQHISEHHRNIIMVFAGTGPDQKYLENLEIEHNNFIFLGNVSESEKKWLLTNCRKFLFLPKNEPLGVTLLEALYYGAEIISYNKGGPKEILLPFKEYLVDTEETYFEALSPTSPLYLRSDIESWLVKNFSADNMCANIVGE